MATAPLAKITSATVAGTATTKAHRCKRPRQVGTPGATGMSLSTALNSHSTGSERARECTASASSLHPSPYLLTAGVVSRAARVFLR